MAASPGPPVPRPVARHPLNVDFDWQPAVPPFGRLTGAQAESYNRHGYTVVEGAVAADEVASLVAAIDPVEAGVTGFLRQQPGGRLFIADAEAITFCTHLVTQLEEARAFCAHPSLVEVAVDLIGPDVRLYWDQAVYKKPEAGREFPWHQDNGYSFVEPQQYLTCWVALTDATVSNGCPWVVPGVHTMGTLQHVATDPGLRCLDAAPDAVPVEVAAGSVVVFSSLTPHRTGPNRTDAVRKAYIVQYAPDGAETVWRGEDGTVVRVRQDDPRRQYAVARAGRRLEPPPS